ncbi:SH3 domain-containing protein [Bacillus sp. D386]|uniref:SH3 domain-containing protein n=1 Tax=Bacillus sp. D386 TaxID=2587155 RepID=UPI00111F8ABB|nr:SH3 domain-containing protein [Bacillus sp. D386]
MNNRYNQPLKVMATSVLLSTGLVLGSSLEPTESFLGMQVAQAAESYYKTTANLNMRKTASIKGQIIITIPKGKQVTYISKNGSWYKVKYGSKTGYVNSNYLKIVPSSTAPATSTSVYTTTANLNLRKTASTRSVILTTIPKGKTVSYLSKSGSWYKVKYGTKTGYVSSSYIKVTNKTSESTSASTTIKSTKYKTTSYLNMRSKATTSSSRLLTIPKNKVITATAKSSSWYKVSYSGQTGWVSGSYIKEYNQTTTTSIAYYKTNATSSLYSAANTNKAAVYSIPKNNIFSSTQKIVNSIGETWYRVSFKGKNYYIKAGSVSKVSAANVTSTSYTANQNTYLYSFAGEKHGTLVSIPKVAKIITSYRIGDWYKTTYGGKTGYINMAKFSKAVTSSSASITDTMFKTTANLNLRKTASTSGEKLDTIAKNTIVTATAKSGDWYKVSYNGKTGWVSGTYLAAYNSSSNNTGSNSSGSSVTENIYLPIAKLNIRASDSTSSAKVGSIPKYTQVKSTYKTSKGWYRVTYGGVTGYVSGDYLITKANYDKMNSYENNKNSYIHMDLRTKSSVTAAQINAYIAKHATSTNSVLYNKGSAFITAANKYGVNALYLAAHAIHESNYGKSTIALAKNNLFGFGSYDSTPFVGSVKFASIEENIAFIAQEMKATYLNPSNWKYKGATLGYTIKDANGNRITDLSKGMNFYYASDSDWGKRIATHMSNILAYGKEGAVSQRPNTTIPAKPSYPSGKDVFPTGTNAVANSSISLRNSKSSSATVAATIKKGETFNLLEKWNDYWLKVSYKGKTYYTNTVSLSTYNNYMTVKNLARVNVGGMSTLNVRASASTEAAKVGSLSNNQYVELVVDSSKSPITNGGWYKVKLSNGKVGWVSGSYLVRELNK